ncbi:MAG: hypothetical protein RLZZ283_596 [Candidatus Parcubacteria bacterium]|jgi:hypothetical protein
MNWVAEARRKPGIRQKGWNTRATATPQKEKPVPKSAWDLAPFRYGLLCQKCGGARQNPGAPYVTKQFGSERVCSSCYHHPIQPTAPANPFP